MIGRTISHYRVLEKLGEGGMGVVYKAEDTKLKRIVALKCLPPHLTANHEAQERFEREAQAIAALNHPNIVTIYEIGEHERQIFTALEYVEGYSLKDKIALASSGANGCLPLPINEILDIAIQICNGLSKAHNVGIVHRDIKPGNILINRDGQVKILDFGLAKLIGVSKLTKESSTLGTVNYMSPEQVQGDETDHRTDIWSFGVVLYEMLTGQLPFKGDYEQVVIYLIINGTPEPITKQRAGVPFVLERIVNKALENTLQELIDACKNNFVDIYVPNEYLMKYQISPLTDEISQVARRLDVIPFDIDESNGIQEYDIDYDKTLNTYNLCENFVNGMSIEDRMKKKVLKKLKEVYNEAIK